MPEYVVYRGQHNRQRGSLIHSRQRAIYFVNHVPVAKYYAQSPNYPGDQVVVPHVLKMHVIIDRPFINSPTDPFIEVSDLLRQLGQKEAERIVRKFANWITQTSHWLELEYPDIETLLTDAPWRLPELYFQAYPFFADDEEVARLQLLGYDGAIHAGNGVSMGAIEYCAFNRAAIELISFYPM